MKKRIILLSGFLIISFFMLNDIAAQEKPKTASKAKIETTNKKTPSKCAGCPSLAKCNKDSAVVEKKENGEAIENKREKKKVKQN